jgi:hypothetical protein
MRRIVAIGFAVVLSVAALGAFAWVLREYRLDDASCRSLYAAVSKERDIVVASSNALAALNDS